MLKINSSFQFNDNDFIKINNFTQPIEKQLKRKDIYELEPFNTCYLENTEGIYETHKHIEKEILDFNPFQSLVSEEIKKEEINNEVDDYIIFDIFFDVKNNCLNKKNHDMQQKKTNLMPIKEDAQSYFGRYMLNNYEIYIVDMESQSDLPNNIDKITIDVLQEKKLIANDSKELENDKSKSMCLII